MPSVAGEGASTVESIASDGSSGSEVGMPDLRWITALPKAEVHLHLEGCIPTSVLGGTDSDTAPHLRDLAEFLEYLDRSCARVTRGDQLERIAYAICARARESGVRHVDVIFNPGHWPAWQRDLGELVARLDAGLAAGELDHGVTGGLCLSLTRTQPPSTSSELVDWLLEARPARVVALSVDGNEAAAGRTGERFAPLFARVREAGLHTCAHAGESSGPDGVRDALELLGAERIDHGIRAVEDAALVADLAARGVPLDVCPTSNVRLGVVASLAAHPIEALRAAGVQVSVNTDDPLLFGTSVAAEYAACARTFGWDEAILEGIARTSIESCFADPDRRRALLGELERFGGRAAEKAAGDDSGSHPPATTPAGGRLRHLADWDGAAYDRLSDPQARWGRAVLERLVLNGSETVLDAGCGSGRVTEALLGRLPHGRVVALDMSPSMLAQARERLADRARIRFVHGDLLALTPTFFEPEGAVDAVFSTATFHWITDHDRLFANIAGVLRPGGQLVAQCGAEGNIERVVAAVRSLGVERAGTWHYPSAEETGARLRAAGFVDVSVWTNTEPTPFPDAVALADFLETVCLREHLATIAPGQRRSFTERVAALMPEPVIDYVRLNIVARRGG